MSDDSRQCYICLDNEGEDDEWVSPCKCSGSLKWVHQRCLIRWVREQEATRPWSPVTCPQCKTRLKLLPEKGTLVTTLEFIDTTVYPVCKYMASCFFGMVAFDAACTTFGIFAQSQVYGLDETLAAVSESDKFGSLMHLHLTTISLVFFNSVSWERHLLKVLRRLSRLPIVGCILPEEVPVRFRLPDESSFSQIIVSSALLPCFAKLVGCVCFSYVDTNLNRVLLGGLTFVGVKGSLYMYCLQKQEVRRKRMVITPYRASVRPSITQ